MNKRAFFLVCTTLITVVLLIWINFYFEYIYEGSANVVSLRETGLSVEKFEGLKNLVR